MIKSRQQNSTAYPINFLMVDSNDGKSGKTGLTPTVTLSKNGGAFASAAGAVSEIGNGWYSLAGNATDRNTFGELCIHATATGAEDADPQYSIVNFDPFVFKPSVSLAAVDVSGNLPADAKAWNGEALPTIGTSTLTAQQVWEYATRTLSAFGFSVALSSEAQAAIITAMAASFVLPVMQGQVYTATAIQSREVVIVQGDTPRIIFDFGADYSGWTPSFGTKAALADTEYAINPKACTWIDDTTGKGYVDLSAAETAIRGKYFAEIELRNGTQRLTAMKFTLKIIDEVIKE